MKRGLLIQFILLFALVLVGYALVFSWIERRRVVKGPWEVTFSAEVGRAQLVIAQTNLNIRDVRIVFPGVVAPSNVVEHIVLPRRRTRLTPFRLENASFRTCCFFPAR